MKHRKAGVGAFLLLGLLLCLQFFEALGLGETDVPMPVVTQTAQKTVVASDEARPDPVAVAFREKRSKYWLEVQGRVFKILPDDNTGRRHQRFLIETSAGQSVLVSHNIDLAPRIPLQKNDTVSLRGRYEWNEKGGVVHWTHHDPSGRHDGGWIRLHDKTYR